MILPGGLNGIYGRERTVENRLWPDVGRCCNSARYASGGAAARPMSNPWCSGEDFECNGLLTTIVALECVE
jgi:hypothetical protein